MATLKRGILFIIFISFLTFGWQAFTFNNQITHPKLTKATAQFYNQNHEDVKLTSQQIDWLVQGSIEEDEPVIRCRNHFYDPETGKGLTDGKYKYLLTVPAPKWANSSRLQSRIWELGDYTWQQAVYNYQQGNYKQAFISLGHVLHLLQDMGVPAHVRNDAHEQGDPFEEWVSENDHKIKVDISKAEKYSCANNKQCLQQLAFYTHNNFFSKDTINKYDLPFDKIKIDKNNLVVLNNKILGVYNRQTGKIKLVEEGVKNKVHQSYWNHLSPKIVSYGTGLINLFFQKANGKKIQEPKNSMGIQMGSNQKQNFCLNRARCWQDNQNSNCYC